MNKNNYPEHFELLPENLRATALLFGTLAQTVIKYFNSEEISLTPLNFIIVSNSFMSPGISMSDLATRIGISKPQLSRSVSKLEEMNLVERRHNQENRRIVNVYPIESGTNLVHEQFENVVEKLDNTLSSLPLEDRQRLNSLMTESLEILSKAGIVPEMKKDSDTKC